MNEGIKRNPQTILEQREVFDDVALRYENMVRLLELVPELKEPILNIFSELNFTEQQSLIKDIQNKKKANEKDVDILQYTVGTIKAYVELESKQESITEGREIFPDRNMN